MSSSSSDQHSHQKEKSYRQHLQYDVFLSFRGEDTRHGFTSFLYDALTRSKIVTFMDKNLEKGRKLDPEIFRVIEGSKISIVVFSRNYAGSRWCLYELEKIMECHRTIGQVVLPVFYDVDPSDVRHQKGPFGEAFEELSRKHSGMIDLLSSWRRALTEAANFAGWDTRHNYEYDAMNRIVEDVLRKLDDASLPTTDFPVGLESRAQDVIQLLRGQSSRVCVLGIWGMGGSGKTTLAKVIYIKFIVNLKIEVSLQMLEKFGRQIEAKLIYSNIEWGKPMIKERLGRTGAFVVLDDVNKDEQLQALCGNRTWIGPGSVIIITTRDIRVLNVLKPDHL